MLAVNVPDKVSMFGEDLHPAPLITSVTDYELPAALHNSNFPAIQRVSSV